MSSILEQIANPNNFGKYVVEVESWENDADHFQTNYYFTNDSEKLSHIMIMLTTLKDVPRDSGWSNSNSKEFALFGVTFKTISELMELESEAYAREDEAGVDVGGLFGNGMSIDLFIELVGGYEYESSLIRQLDSFKTFKLGSDGKLEEI